MLLLFAVFGGCTAHGFLEGSGEVGRVVVGAELRYLADRKLWMARQQMAGTRHADILDKGLRRLARQRRHALTELEGTHTQPFGHGSSIHLAATHQLVDDVHRLLDEAAVGIRQLKLLLRSRRGLLRGL